MSRQLPLNLRLKDGSSFENYLSGGNASVVEHLRAAIVRLARGEKSETVLFLRGPAGTGRTHLLQAACREIHNAGLGAMYVPLGEASIVPALLEDLEGVALVCLDDVERIAGNEEWERALFALVERLRVAGGMLVAAGARPPRELGLKLPDLATRLGWGAVYALRPLDDAGRIGAVQLRARNRGLEMPDDVARYILARYPRDLDSLFALLDRLDTASFAEQRRLTIPFLRRFEEQRP
jgi:DnaA family protein